MVCRSHILVSFTCVLLSIHPSRSWWPFNDGTTSSTTTLHPGYYVHMNSCPLKKCHVNIQKDINCALSGCTQIDPEIPPDVAGLYFQDNKITQVPPLPYTNLTILDLSDNQISVLDDNAFSDLENLGVLYLSRNKIRVLKKSYFRTLTNLRVLYLDQNVLTHVPSDVFYPYLISLEKLDLSTNMISSIESQAFSDVVSLMTLKLGNNNLTSIKREHLKHLPRLEELDLRNNKIKVVERYTFADLLQLRTLELSYNEIWALPNNSFALEEAFRESQLTTLGLSNNQIGTLPRDVFQGLKNLRNLMLQYNPLEVLPSNALPKSLKNFYLHHMKNLKKIESRAFSGLSELEHIEITHNRQLRRISPGAFDVKFKSLRLLDLSRNDLRTMSKDILEDWNRIQETDLSGNPWQCDCNIRWMNEIYMRKEDRDTIRCDRPSHLFGKQLSSIPENELVCGRFARFQLKRGRLGIGLVVFATLIFLTGVFAFVFRCRRKIFPCRYGETANYRALYDHSVPEKDEIEIKKSINVSETEKKILLQQANGKLPEPVAL